MFSGRIILNFGISERLRAFRYPIFTGGVVEENSICSAAFCESAALQEKLLPAFSRLTHYMTIFPLRPLCVKMRLERSAERDKRKNKNNSSADDAQSATTTTAASGGSREELLGQRPARRACRPRHDADAGCRNPIAEGILNRFACPKRLSAEKQQTAFSASHSCNLCNCDKFS